MRADYQAAIGTGSPGAIGHSFETKPILPIQNVAAIEGSSGFQVDFGMRSSPPQWK